MEAFCLDFQLDAFVYFLYTGFFFGFFYSLLRLIFEKRSFFLRVIADFLLAVILSFMLFLSIYLSNAAKLRLYMLFAFALGMIIYHAGIHRLFKIIISFLRKKGKSRPAANNTSTE